MKFAGTFQKDQILIPVEITIDNFKLRGSAEFLLDTGSPISFINESTALKIHLDYSQLLQTTTIAGVGGGAEVYQIDGFTRLTFENGEDRKTIPRKNFLAVRHDFCEHVTEDVRKRILSLQGILGMDIIKGGKLTTSGANYTLEI